MTKKIPVTYEDDLYYVKAVVEVFYKDLIERTDTDRGVKIDRFAVPSDCEIIVVINQETNDVMRDVPEELQKAIEEKAMIQAEKNSYDLSD